MRQVVLKTLAVLALASALSACTFLPPPWRLWVTVGTFVAATLILAARLLYVAVPVQLLYWRQRDPPPLPPVKLTPCPTCGHTDHQYKNQGLWDSRDLTTGEAVGGCFRYGVCKACGSRWATWDGGPPYVPSDEEWEREVVAPEAHGPKRQQERLWLGRVVLEGDAAASGDNRVGRAVSVIDLERVRSDAEVPPRPVLLHQPHMPSRHAALGGVFSHLLNRGRGRRGPGA